MFDCQSFFGDTHWAYNKFKYQIHLQEILLFYASFLPCDVKPNLPFIHELIPEFEKLHILKRDSSGEIKLDIPALPFDEAMGYWNPMTINLSNELFEYLKDDLTKIWTNTKNRVPRHVDEAEYHTHEGALGAFAKAQLLEIVNQKLMPYPVIIGKTPIIYISYRKRKD